MTGKEIIQLAEVIMVGLVVITFLIMAFRD